MSQSNSLPRIDPSLPRAALMYPATHTLMETWPPQTASPLHDLSFDAAAWHARQIIDKAMKAGDHATAALITEAFARIALHAGVTRRPDVTQPGQPREYATLRNAAMDMIAVAYPSGDHVPDLHDLAELDALIAALEGTH